MQQPLCLLCLEDNIITPVDEIHHIKPILTGNSEDEQTYLLLDPNNVIGLCTKHHHYVHKLYNSGR